jgi:hypothetical protein
VKKKKERRGKFYANREIYNRKGAPPASSHHPLPRLVALGGISMIDFMSIFQAYASHIFQAYLSYLSVKDRDE